jgi:hypothetical protein
VHSGSAMPDVAPLSTFLMLAISFCGTFGGIPMLTPETLAHRIRFPADGKSGLVKEIRLLFHKNVTNSGEYLRIG